MRETHTLYSSVSNPLFGTVPEGWQKILIKSQFLLIIPYSLLVVILAILSLSIINSSSEEDASSRILLLALLFFVLLLISLLLRSFLQVNKIKMYSEGIKGDFAKKGILTKVRERRIFGKFFFGWVDIESIYISNFKTIHIVDKNNINYTTTVENVLDFLIALKEAKQIDKFDINRTRSLLGMGWVYGRGLLGMHQSSKAYSKLFEDLEKIIEND